MPGPKNWKTLNINKAKEEKSNQKDKLFKRGKAISTEPSIKGINQFPNPPIVTGITEKKIIIKACEVTTTLYKWSWPAKEPGWDNSKRIIDLKEVPKKADQSPRTK